MWAYVVRKLLLTIPTVLGIVLVTFLLFNVVAKDPASRVRRQDEERRAVEPPSATRMGLDQPKWKQFLNVLTFQFPQVHAGTRSRSGR